MKLGQVCRGVSWIGFGVLDRGAHAGRAGLVSAAVEHG